MPVDPQVLADRTTLLARAATLRAKFDADTATFAERLELRNWVIALKMIAAYIIRNGGTP